MAKEKTKTIDDTIELVRKKYGDGAVTYGAGWKAKDVKPTPTGIFSLDLALGIGGLPLGRMVEIFGPEGCGKTTLALHTVAEAQKAGHRCVFIDVEHALDPTYASVGIGVNMEELILAQPDSGEEAIEIARAFAETKNVRVIVIDSVAALLPQAEINAELGDSRPGAQARLMSESCRRLKGIINDSGAVLIFINQLREKIGMMGYGSPVSTPGGKALKYYASVRIDLKRIGQIKSSSDKDPIGHKVLANIVKNKVAAPFKKSEFEIYYDGTGISKSGDILDYAKENKIVDVRGSWYQIVVPGGENIKIGNGKQAAMLELETNTELMDMLLSKLKVEDKTLEDNPIETINADTTIQD